MVSSPFLVAVSVCIPKGLNILPVQQEMVMDYGPSMNNQFWFGWESETRILTMHAGEADAELA